MGCTRREGGGNPECEGEGTGGEEEVGREGDGGNEFKAKGGCCSIGTSSGRHRGGRDAGHRGTAARLGGCEAKEGQGTEGGAGQRAAGGAIDGGQRD